MTPELLVAEANGQSLPVEEIRQLTARKRRPEETLADIVRLLQKRGRYMQEACDQTPSGMVSILGLDREKCAQACQGQGDVGVANLNAPGQIVLSGEALAITDGDPDDILVIAGQLVITSPVHKVGYKQVIVAGQVFED